MIIFGLGPGMTEFVDVEPDFSKVSGGNVGVDLLATDKCGKSAPLFDFVMPRAAFYRSLAKANAFADQLRKEEAAEYIASLPRGKTRAVL